MEARRSMTPTERRLFKEAVIREYKLKQEQIRKHNNYYQEFISTLRKIAPINIILGIIASILLIVLKGWESFLQLILTGIIWITIISTVLAATGKKR